MPVTSCLYSNEAFQSDGGLFIGLRLPQHERGEAGAAPISIISQGHQ